MSQNLLSRPGTKHFDAKVPAPTQTLSASEQPLDEMHACLNAARELERLALDLDAAASARDAALTNFANEHKAKLATIEAENKKRVDNANAIKANAEQSIATEKSQVKNMIDSVAKSGGFISYMTLEVGDVPLASDTGPEIAQMIREVTEVVNQWEQKVNAFHTAFGPGQSLGAVILFGLLLSFLLGFAVLQSSLGGFIGLALGIALVITIYVRRKQGVATARDELRSLAKSLKKRNLHDGYFAQEKADALFNSQQEANATEYKKVRDARNAENNQAVATTKANFDAKKEALSADINARYGLLQSNIGALSQGLARGDWNDEAWQNWEPTGVAPGCLRIGTLQPQTPRFSGHFLQLDKIQIPALIDYEAGKGIVIYAEGALDEARQMAQSAITRLLGTVPPAGVKFVFLDPVSLGGNVAGFMKLEKYEPTLIGGKAWSDARHIETALAEVTDHMETVIQKYLREDYKSIAAYNAEARVKEAYRVVVAFDFPVNFSETSAKRLNSIMRNGPRCGVFPIVIVDRSKPMPYGINLEDLQTHALVIQSQR